MKQRRYPFLRLAALFTLSACLLCAQGLCEDTASASAETGISGQQVDLSALFSDQDLDGSYDESGAVSIRLNGGSASCDSDAVAIDGTQIILLDEGVYILSGTLEDGQVVVSAGEEDKVQIVLQGAQINSGTSAAIYALEADKVFLTLAKDTENTLTNGGEYVDIDDNAIDAVVFSKTDLTLNGSGSLLVEAAAAETPRSASGIAPRLPLRRPRRDRAPAKQNAYGESTPAGSSFCLPWGSIWCAFGASPGGFTCPGAFCPACPRGADTPWASAPSCP